MLKCFFLANLSNKQFSSCLAIQQWRARFFPWLSTCVVPSPFPIGLIESSFAQTIPYAKEHSFAQPFQTDQTMQERVPIRRKIPGL
jgi:hypothetical protein